MAWPPTLTDLKTEVGITDAADDAALQRRLDAAVSFVEDVSEGRARPLSHPDSVLGTLLLAHRWFVMRRAPDGLVNTGDFGTSRVPTVGQDIERLLKIGRYAPVVFA